MAHRQNAIIVTHYTQLSVVRWHRGAYETRSRSRESHFTNKETVYDAGPRTLYAFFSQRSQISLNLQYRELLKVKTCINNTNMR